MNYEKIYNNLIEKAKCRELTGYKEEHHIIPKCLGGNNDISNLIHLTPEEHYLAHQLLVKIYKGNHKLIYAANMMVVNRKTNKYYGWLKRKHINAIKIDQLGNKNSQYGTRWIYSDILKENRKIYKNEKIPDGWCEGRKLDFSIFEIDCDYCGKKHNNKNSKFCSSLCRRYSHSNTIKIIDDNILDILEKFKLNKSITKTLSYYGLGGRQGNKYLSEILKERGFEVLKRRNSK